MNTFKMVNKEPFASHWTVYKLSNGNNFGECDSSKYYEVVIHSNALMSDRGIIIAQIST